MTCSRAPATAVVEVDEETDGAVVVDATDVDGAGCGLLALAHAASSTVVMMARLLEQRPCWVRSPPRTAVLRTLAA
jgi:hypothetical protein